MWKREKWEDYANELENLSQRFRAAYLASPKNSAELSSTSIDAAELLRALALAIRSDQDHKQTSRPESAVGALKEPGGPIDFPPAGAQYSGYTHLLHQKGYTKLKLRAALNKIAHADPGYASFYVSQDGSKHELFLCGAFRGQGWFAAISVPALVGVIRGLRDVNAPT